MVFKLIIRPSTVPFIKYPSIKRNKSSVVLDIMLKYKMVYNFVMNEIPKYSNEFIWVSVHMYKAKGIEETLI